MSPERRYAFVPVPVSTFIPVPALVSESDSAGPGAGSVLEGDHTAAQRPQVRYDLCEVEGRVRRLKTLALEKEGERRGRERGEFGV